MQEDKIIKLKLVGLSREIQETAEELPESIAHGLFQLAVYPLCLPRHLLAVINFEKKKIAREWNTLLGRKEEKPPRPHFNPSAAPRNPPKVPGDRPRG